MQSQSRRDASVTATQRMHIQPWDYGAFKKVARSKMSKSFRIPERQ